MKFLVTISILLFSFNTLLAQIPFVVIDSIELSGNHHTKDYVIYNELDFSRGDTIYFQNLEKLFKDNKNRLLSTGLFVDAGFNLKKYNSNTNRGTISIKIIESWYIYPTVYFELTDRNFNDWFYDHDAKLNRINIALDLNHKNLSGNRDPLKIKIQRGITKKLELQYIRPFLSMDHRIGFVFNTMYKYSKEIPFNTINNKLIFYRDENKNMFRQFRISTGLFYRPELLLTHKFEFNFYDNLIDTLVQNKFNPYFFNKDPIQKYFEFRYAFVFDKREFRVYPKGGYFFGFSLVKSGLGIFKDLNILDLYASVEKYFPLYNSFISVYKLKAKKRLLSKKASYFNNKSLGYEEDYLNGYELYVIDGEDYFYLKSAQKIKLLSGKLNLKRLIKINQFQLIPYEFYLSFNFDLGYVNNNSNFVSNNFTNRFLYGYGPGLDMIIYNNYFQLNYSVNHIGEGGIFFHYKTKI
ncbi:MAG TPA: outer membrane protein assembly factor [Bacteroidetes bacterium]|nr:outer membrane protein assembly factor [Bacteroidota bacterium]